jgi:hypothetical protein
LREYTRLLFPRGVIDRVTVAHCRTHCIVVALVCTELMLAEFMFLRTQWECKCEYEAN